MTKPTSKQLSGGSLTPSSYTVKSATITLNDGKDVDISNLLNKFEIHESLNTPFIEVVMTIVDATNFLEEVKISGNERILLHISRNPNSDKKDPAQFKLKLDIAEVFSYFRNEPTKQFYRFRCVSPHVYNNQVLNLSYNFRGTIGSLISKICDLIKVENKDIDTSSKSIVKGIYPSIKPLSAASWLLRNAFSSNTNYYFYETAKEQKVNLKSYHDMTNEDVFDTYEFLPGFKNEIGSQEYYDEVRKRIRIIDGDLNMGQLQHLSNGSYSSTIHTLDIATKTFKKTKFGYKNGKLNSSKSFNGDSKVLNKGYDKHFDSKNYYVSLNSKAFDSVDNYHAPLDGTLSDALASKNKLDFNSFNIILPGDFDLTVGNTINIKVIKASDSEHLNTKNLEDKYLSGKYLITRITHDFNDEYIQRLTIKRDSIGVEL